MSTGLLCEEFFVGNRNKVVVNQHSLSSVHAPWEPVGSERVSLPLSMNRILYMDRMIELLNIIFYTRQCVLSLKGHSHMIPMCP